MLAWAAAFKRAILAPGTAVVSDEVRGPMHIERLAYQVARKVGSNSPLSVIFALPGLKSTLVKTPLIDEVLGCRRPCGGHLLRHQGG
jgi:hypothetical protein